VAEGSEGPPARWQHCMVTTGEHLYILGGSGQGGSILADVYRFELLFLPVWKEFLVTFVVVLRRDCFYVLFTRCR
jgi:hypothetical protein